MKKNKKLPDYTSDMCPRCYDKKVISYGKKNSNGSMKCVHCKYSWLLP